MEGVDRRASIGVGGGRAGHRAEARIYELLAAKPGALLPMLVPRLCDTGRIRRARAAYAALVEQIRADGYHVEIYHFPVITEERRAGSTLLQRLLGLVDVSTDREVWMLYSSVMRGIGPALLWSYDPEAQAIGVGSTGGGPDIPGHPQVPALDWEELAEDLRRARRSCDDLLIHSLEGCVQRGFSRSCAPSTGTRKRPGRRTPGSPRVFAARSCSLSGRALTHGGPWVSRALRSGSFPGELAPGVSPPDVRPRMEQAQVGHPSAGHHHDASGHSMICLAHTDGASPPAGAQIGSARLRATVALIFTVFRYQLRARAGPRPGEPSAAQEPSGRFSQATVSSTPALSAWRPAAPGPRSAPLRAVAQIRRLPRCAAADCWLPSWWRDSARCPRCRRVSPGVAGWPKRGPGSDGGATWAEGRRCGCRRTGRA